MSTISKPVLLGTILGVIFGLLTYFVGIRGPTVTASTDVGTVGRGMLAPGFSLKDLQGRTVSLEDYKGQTVLLNFWASWCQPCLEEMPSLQGLYQKFKDRKFTILAVNLNETNQDLQDFLAKNGISFPTLVEGQECASRYGTEKVPESYLIDERGIVLQKIIGARDWLDPKVVSYFDGLLPR